MSSEKPPAPPIELLTRVAPERSAAGGLCSRYRASLDNYLGFLCAQKVNEMTPDADNPRCPCSRDPAASGVDLVVLVDSSGSMSGTWASLADAAAAAIDAAGAACGVEPRVEWLYVDPSDTGVGMKSLPSPFDLSHEEYLVGVGASGPFAADHDGPLDQEQGAKAIVDLARHFDWREGACRAIFYLSDELLDSLSKTRADSRKAADAAIAAAQAAGVTLFTHFVATGGASVDPSDTEVAGHYRDLAEKTGGQAHIGDGPSVELYTELLETAICRSCGEPSCTAAELPDLRPCIHVTWGDSDCDCIESDDHETLCITVCNCYSNVTFSNLEIQIAVVVDGDGSAVATLPDGTPSVQLLPVGPLCFGDVGPCRDGEETCVSRQLVLLNRGARAGKYRVWLAGICFDLVHHYAVDRALFDFEICRD